MNCQRSRLYTVNLLLVCVKYIADGTRYWLAIVRHKARAFYHLIIHNNDDVGHARATLIDKSLKGLHNRQDWVPRSASFVIAVCTPDRNGDCVYRFGSALYWENESGKHYEQVCIKLNKLLTTCTENLYYIEWIVNEVAYTLWTCMRWVNCWRQTLWTCIVLVNYYRQKPWIGIALRKLLTADVMNSRCIE